MNEPTNVKSELRMMTVNGAHFAIWREFIERHHHRELINPHTGDMYKEKQSFILSTKFFKHFGHFTNADFKVYVPHLLGCTPSRRARYPKVSVHKTTLLQESHHTGHGWVERRKRKQVVLEELVELQPNLKFIRSNGSVNATSGRSGRWTIERHLQHVVSTRELVLL